MFSFSAQELAQMAKFKAALLETDGAELDESFAALSAKRRSRCISEFTRWYTRLLEQNCADLPRHPYSYLHDVIDECCKSVIEDELLESRSESEILNRTHLLAEELLFPAESKSWNAGLFLRTIREPKCFDAFWDQNEKAVQNHCRRYVWDNDVAKSVASDAGIKVFGIRNRFMSERNLQGWILKIARNKAFNAGRKLKHRTSRMVRIDDFEDFLETSVGEDSSGKTRFDIDYYKCLDTLSEDERLVWTLREHEYESFVSIGALIRKSDVTARNLYLASKKKLKRCMER